MTRSAPRCWAVVPAAGIGSRMDGDVPKQYLELAGATVLEHSLRALLDSSLIEGLVVALHPEDQYAATIALLADERITRATGAEQRSGSVLAALDALAAFADERDWVLVHDAARPCLRCADLRRLVAQVREEDCGGILAEPVVIQ